VFEVVVGLEERIASEKLHQDAPDTPDVTWETPAQVQYDFGGPIVPRGDNGGVVFVVEGGRAKVDEPDLAVEKDSSLAGISGIRVRGRGNGAVVGEGLVSVADEEDVFGLQVGVDEVEVVED
jgi:hypothetical protein